MSEVKVTRISENSRVNREGLLERIMEVQFTVGDNGPFTLEVPVDEFDEISVREKISSKAREIQAVMNISP